MTRDFDPERDCYESYMAAVAELRRRYLAGDSPECNPPHATGAAAIGAGRLVAGSERAATSAAAFPLAHAAGAVSE